MMGPEDDKGLIPRLCERLFDVIGERAMDQTLTFKVEVRLLGWQAGYLHASWQAEYLHASWQAE